MKEVKEYRTDYDIPTDEEIKQGIEIAENYDCIVIIKWFVRYSGWYELHIKKGMTFEECQAKLPKYYPV